MDITALVMTAHRLYGVQAVEAAELALPVSGAAATAVTFPDHGQAVTFAAACMAEGLSARAYGPTVVILH